ncbi:MAG: hypothetical protein VX112_04030 [Pseudomonadota bacterium]|nr:hypothetical protein [Pseudomonadota bacterium]
MTNYVSELDYLVTNLHNLLRSDDTEFLNTYLASNEQKFLARRILVQDIGLYIGHDDVPLKNYICVVNHFTRDLKDLLDNALVSTSIKCFIRKMTTTKILLPSQTWHELCQQAQSGNLESIKHLIRGDDPHTFGFKHLKIFHNSFIYYSTKKAQLDYLKEHIFPQLKKEFHNQYRKIERLEIIKEWDSTLNQNNFSDIKIFCESHLHYDLPNIPIRGKLPISIAIEKNNVALINFLLKKGTLEKENGFTEAFSTASRYGNTAVLTYLIQYKSNKLTDEIILEGIDQAIYGDQLTTFEYFKEYFDFKPSKTTLKSCMRHSALSIFQSLYNRKTNHFPLHVEIEHNRGPISCAFSMVENKHHEFLQYITETEKADQASVGSELAEPLIDKIQGAIPNCLHAIDKKTSMQPSIWRTHIAHQHEQEEIDKRQIHDAGLTIHSPLEKGYSLVHYAVKTYLEKDQKLIQDVIKYKNFTRSLFLSRIKLDYLIWHKPTNDELITITEYKNAKKNLKILLQAPRNTRLRDLLGAQSLDKSTSMHWSKR